MKSIENCIKTFVLLFKPGECWSGPSKNETAFKEDGQSDNCVDTEWKSPCDDVSKMACAGKEFNNYVYAIP